MAAREFREHVRAANLCLIAELFRVEEEWSKRPLSFRRLGMSPESLCECVRKGFGQFLSVAQQFQTEIGPSPVEWAEKKTARLLKKRLKPYPDWAVPLAEVLRYLDVLAAKQTLHEPSAESKDEQAGAPGAEQRKTTTVKEVSKTGHALVNAFIRTMRDKGHKITRKAISTVAGYDCRSELWRFETGKRCTAAARTNFNRVLGLAPEEFIRELKIKSNSK